MNLIYTVAFEQSSQSYARQTLKLLCSSILRSMWSGKILAFHNFSLPIFPLERKGLDEIYIKPLAPGSRRSGAPGCLQAGFEGFLQASQSIQDPWEYGWIVFLDANCLLMRDIEHLLTDDVDILVQTERGRLRESNTEFNGCSPVCPALPAENIRLHPEGINVGVFAIRGTLFHEVIGRWHRVYLNADFAHDDYRDQCSFNGFIMQSGLRVKSFERGEIMFPLHLDTGFLDYKHAAILRFFGGSELERLEMAFAMYMMRTYCEPRGSFLELLES